MSYTWITVSEGALLKKQNNVLTVVYEKYLFLSQYAAKRVDRIHTTNLPTF